MACCTRTNRISLLLLAVLSGVFAFLLILNRPTDRYGHLPESPALVQEPLFPVPEFQFTERNGLAVSDRDLRGKVWVASFIFTRCTGSCPAVTATIAALHQETADVADFRMVTFTVDPDRDSPDELKKYADRYGADPKRWLFLTGPEAELHQIAKDGFKFATGRNSEREPGQEEFLHTSKIALVDKRGMVRQIFDGLFVGSESESQRAETIARIKDAINILQQE